jgi:nucleoid-associated protein YgaU
MPLFSRGGVAKLEIIPLKKNITETDTSWSLDNDAKVTCQFNPESLSMSKSNQWAFRTDIGDDTPETVFGGGNSGSMSLELLFDSTHTGDDVRQQYVKLLKVTMVKPSDNNDGKGEPRQVVVQWGSFVSYVAVIESLSQNFTLFKEDGTPLRAQLSVSLREVWSDKKLPEQNPTSRSDVRRTWVVEKGQRLDWIAHQVYGNSGTWRHIAESNGLSNPAMLRPGQILKIVPLE